MSGFTTEWLALRERYDLAARNSDVLEAVTISFKSRPFVHVVDLACGSGSTLRALHARLPARQHWDLVDNDPALLALACSHDLGEGVTLSAVPLDLSRNFKAPLRGTIDLITISALLDLVSANWLHQFSRAVAVEASPIYAALTYDGRADLSPPDSFDQAVVSSVNAHQRTDKGFGPALGLLAASAAVASFRSLGYSVLSGESDWAIGPDDWAMQNKLLEAWASAARDLGTLSCSEIAGWLQRRKALVSAGRSTMRVGHVDFFATASSTR